MHTKTMEGLAGASANIKMVDVPFRVYKEARRKGDTATMERAMGYAGEFAEKAEDYKAEADEGMKEDAKEAREKEKLELEKAIEKRRGEREKSEAEEGEAGRRKTDTVEISAEGMALMEEAKKSGAAISENKSNKTGSKPALDSGLTDMSSVCSFLL